MQALTQSLFSGAWGAALVRLLNMSAAAGVLICAVALLRLALKNAPKWTRGILWAIVAVQLVCPVAPASPLSVYGLLRRGGAAAEQVEVFHALGGSEKPLLTVDTPRIAAPAAPEPAPQTSEHSVYLPAAGALWLAGVAAMLLYALVSYLCLRRQVRASLPLEECVMLCDDIDTPFLLGIFRPRVYLPSKLPEARRAAVLAHERAHLRRGDHIWKPLGFLLLSLHWFNPLVWLAYVLFCRDMELACDERVVREMDAAARADYSQALLDCSLRRSPVRACPLAFGELGVKERVKRVLSYKKPAFWIVALTVAACCVVAVCFLTRPADTQSPGRTPEVTPTPQPTGMPVTGALDRINMETANTYILDDEYYSTPVNPIMRFYILLDRENGLFQYYETPISSYIGLGRYRLDGDILTIEDHRVNRFRMEDDALVWLAEGSDNFTFVQLNDGAVFHLDTTPRTRQMTLDDVRALAQKGEGLTWDDLRPFTGEDVGSGLYIYRYPIDETYCLEARGGSLEGAPMSVLLLHVDEAGGFRPSTGYAVDIRTDDIDSFLAAQANEEPYLTVTSGDRSVAAYPIIISERIWADDQQCWIAADGAPAAAEVLAHPERIPTLALRGGFTASFGGGATRKSGLNVYDGQFQPLRSNWYGDTALLWLDPGTYYCDIEVHGPLGRYIASEAAYEESAYHCIFRLTVAESGPAAFTPEAAHDLTKAELHLRDEDIVLTDPAALQKLENWLVGAREMPGGAGCPFGSVLTLTLADGGELSLCPAEDSCGTVFSGGRYYRCADGNEAFWALFGVDRNPIP